MASASIDHMISLTIFMAAFLIFIGLFSQNMQTGIAYERHNALSTKTSDLLDNMLLNPGIPSNWGQTDNVVVGFGLQDPDFSQYKLSSFSPMRLASYAQSPVYYKGAYYSNATSGLGSYLLVQSVKSVNYTAISKLLGINGTYGFQLTLTPTITVSIVNTSIAPLKLSVNVYGTGYPLANAPLSYSFLYVTQDAKNYPSYTMINGVNATDPAGTAELVFPQITNTTQSYVFIVYSNLDGLKGMGCYVHNSASLTKTVVPLISSFQNRTILLVHGDSIGQPMQPPVYSQLNYNVSFYVLTEDSSLRQVQLDQSSAVGKVVYDSVSDPDYQSITVPDNNGILIVSYKGAAGQYGIALMPWGLGSMAFPLTFGGNSAGQEWVTTDIRQVTIDSLAYQAKLELWNLQGISGSG